MDLKALVSNTLVKWFKQLGFLGWVRFRMLQMVYKLFPSIGSKGEEWKFVLNYLDTNNNKKIRPPAQWVLDVGGTTSLFVYELEHRGFKIIAVDPRPFQEKLPKSITFIQGDVCKLSLTNIDIITAFSVVEHIGMGDYGEKKFENGNRLGIEAFHRILNENGLLLITLPLKTWHSVTVKSLYTYPKFKKLIEGKFEIIEYTERKGHLCAACVKI